jgi:hypothetical protein
MIVHIVVYIMLMSISNCCAAINIHLFIYLFTLKGSQGMGGRHNSLENLRASPYKKDLSKMRPLLVLSISPDSSFKAPCVMYRVSHMHGVQQLWTQMELCSPTVMATVMTRGILPTMVQVSF